MLLPSETYPVAMTTVVEIIMPNFEIILMQLKQHGIL